MEIHHAHAPGKEKHFRHYLFEFLMLFLAVSAGFFVENLREHIAEHQREKQYIRSFAEDLKKDIIQLDSLLQKREMRKIQIDSLNFILQSSDPDLYGKQLYYYSRYLPRPFIFVSNDATVQQLKNSGNLRLIRKLEVMDTILAYDRQYHFIDYIRNREDQLVLRLFPFMDELFDPVVYDQMNLYDIEFKEPPGNPKLLTKDKKILQQFMSEIHYLKTVNFGQIGWFKRQKARAETTLVFIQKEYHLE
jgi:hypothetical protein